MDYVVGLMFDDSSEEVLLIKKKRPKWQDGLLNGIGGKVEKDESPLDAMIREFEEETGILHYGWEYFATISGADGSWCVFFFKAFSNKIYNAKQTTDEPCGVYWAGDLPQNAISNLTWLIPMALDINIKNDVISNMDTALSVRKGEIA